MAAANNIAGAAMLPEETPTIVIRRPNSDVKKLCSELTQIVYMMSGLHREVNTGIINIVNTGWP